MKSFLRFILLKENVLDMWRNINLYNVVIILSLVACKNKSPKTTNTPLTENVATVMQQEIIPGPGKIRTDDYVYLSDSVFHGYKELLKYQIEKYKNDTCTPNIIEKESLNDFEGFKSVGDINNDGKSDSVFVLDALDWCAESQSYYFTDTSLPRITNSSNCCHPYNVFKAPDIDEDGICEIGVYYSSCASRYKSVILYSLKGNEWIEIGVSSFDILTQDPEKVKLETLVKKISRNKFKMKNFMEGDKYWETIDLNKDPNQ